MAAAGEDLDHSSAPEKASSAASPPPPSRNQRSVHQTLGDGALADVLLWRSRKTSALVVAAATAFWVLFELAGYSFLSLVANSLLLLVTILFFWAKSASLLNRPLPPLPKLEISDELAGRAAAQARVWINPVLAVARDIAIERDRKLFLQVILGLWLVSYIGSFFNFLTLVYIGVLLSLTLPALYDKYQDHVDEKLRLVHGLALKHCGNILSKTTKESNNEKKTQ